MKKVYCYFCQLALLSAICFLLSSLIANTATILINFQPKFGLVRSFQPFAINFLNPKRFLARLKSTSRSTLSWQGKCDIFFTRVARVISRNRSKQLASENGVTELSELQMHVQINLFASRKYFVR